MMLERRKRKISRSRAEENQEKRGYSGGKPRKVILEQRKTKKSGISAEENKEMRNKC